MTEAAAQLGIARSTLRDRLRKADAPPRDFDVDPVPSDLRPVEELIAARKAQFARRDAAERAGKLIGVNVKLDGPIGIVHFGDPHVDDDGTDMATLERHVALVRDTDGMFGVNIGDSQNNWVGRLSHLYGKQAMKAQEAWALVEWLIGELESKWVFLISGNHDAWSGTGDPLKWIAKQSDVMYKPDGARVALRFPNGREVRINARHDWPGRSQFNPAHGQVKAALMGWRDHIIIGGHTHSCGYSFTVDPSTGMINHCVRVGTYKTYDDYARQCGFASSNVSPAVCTIIDPDSPTEAGLVHVDFCVERAADYLAFLRKRRCPLPAPRRKAS